MAQKLTPMLQQYVEAKERFPDALLFFRMGDFYELFFEDAKIAAKQLQLTLTHRGKADGDDVPMAGVPHHAAQTYISQLTDLGFSVAIAEQIDDPATTKGLVRRDVVRVVTPGVVLDTDTLDASSPNYVATLYAVETAASLGFGLAYLDASTGDFKCTQLNHINDAISEISRVQPKELLVNELAQRYLDGADRDYTCAFTRTLKEEDFLQSTTLSALRDKVRLADDLTHDASFLSVQEFKTFLQRIQDYSFKQAEPVVAAVSAILLYIIKTQRGIPSNISSLQPYQSNAFLVIDDATRANLELTETLMGGKKKGSLLSVIDKTDTPLGARLLRHWLAYPLLDCKEIQARLDAVYEIYNQLAAAQDLKAALGKVYDLERLCGRLSAGTANAKDLKSLEQTLHALPELLQAMKDLKASLWQTLKEGLDPYQDLRELLSKAIVEDPPTSIQEGGLFKRGYDEKLDEILELSENGRSWMLTYESQLKERTQIPSLKVRFNRVFGYFIEVTKANLDLVPDDFIRKQTLSNCERYFTPELKDMEEKILHARDNRHSLELELFHELRRKTLQYTSSLLETARRLATIDVLNNFASIAKKNNYQQPTINSSGKLNLIAARHPVVEQNLDGDQFIPNDILLDTENHYLQIITGPNMSGKSTVIRQVALIVIMAQMGCFVPAKSAEIGIVDKVFSRVGASDNLARGESTFMVEMTEAAHILKNATSASLIILDEIGRGTSTFDGLSIAWAVAEYLHDTTSARTMFATHYHELTELTRTLHGAVNMSVAAKQYNDTIIFLRKLVKGEANRSYGIEVAKLAGLPDCVIQRAKEVLENLEDSQFDERGLPIPGRKQNGEIRENTPHNPDQLSLFTPINVGPTLLPWQQSILNKLKDIDTNNLTPIQALTLLDQLCKMLK